MADQKQITAEALQTLYETMTTAHDNLERALNIVDSNITIDRMKAAGLEQDRRNLSVSLNNIREEEFDFLAELEMQVEGNS